MDSKLSLDVFLEKPTPKALEFCLGTKALLSRFAASQPNKASKIFPIPKTLKLPSWELQRFAAEDEGRTEAPTERRLREEREKGNVPKSNDLTGAAVLLGTVVILFLSGNLMIQGVTEIFHRFLSGDFRALTQLSIEDLEKLAFEIFWMLLKIVAPLMGVAMLFAIVGNVTQVGLMFTLRSLEFKLERITPDWKRVLPVRRNIINLIKIIFQVGVIAAAAYFVIAQDYLPMLASANMQLNQAIALFAWTALKLLAITAIILLGIAIPDFFYQKFEYMENLKMQVSEVKRERKEDEGDPMLRQRQRERGQELRQRSQMLQEVPKADVVITNPTHFAVALRYVPEERRAPHLLAKGADNLAFRIRTIAHQQGIHIEENPPLARAIYDEVKIGQEIPESLYKTMSVIFSKLQKIRKIKPEIKERVQANL